LEINGSLEQHGFWASHGGEFIIVFLDVMKRSLKETHCFLLIPPPSSE